MKYGTSKYNIIKYGKYIISKQVSGSFGTTYKLRLRSSNVNIVAQNVLCSNDFNKIRVNGIIGQNIVIDGQYNLIRIKSDTDTDWTIAKVV